MSLFLLAALAHAGGLVVHEWGTFTSVSAADGVPLVWRPLEGATDLPDFVYTTSEFDEPRTKSSMTALVRMETPVVYFHPCAPMDVSLRVDFPEGRLTEWYPAADIAQPHRLDWGTFHVDPAISRALFPTDGTDNHYYPARATNAAPVQVDTPSGAQVEGFLFYRGVGSFTPPVTATLQDDEVRWAGKAAGPVLLFEREGDRVALSVGTAARMARSTHASLTDVHEALTTLLLATGLYEDEVRAMLATWNDHWFDDGLRLFYVLTETDTERILPMTIEPRPHELVRVLVGRIEMLTPEAQADARKLAHAGDYDEIEDRYGRFTQPLLTSSLIDATPGDRAVLERAFVTLAELQASAAPAL